MSEPTDHPRPILWPEDYDRLYGPLGPGGPMNDAIAAGMAAVADEPFENARKLDEARELLRLYRSGDALAWFNAMNEIVTRDGEDSAYNRMRRVFNRVETKEANDEGDRIYEARRLDTRGPLPELVSLTDLLAEPDEETLYRVDGLWPAGGKIVLAAQFKAGKTTMVGNLVRCLADGDAFLDQFHVDPIGDGTIVVIDNELAKNMTRRWLRDQGVKNTGHVVICPMRGESRKFDVRDDTVRAEWADRLKAVKCRVLIVDCLGPILSALGIEEGDNTAVGGILDGLDALCKEAGVLELAVIHHMGHNAERTRGASRLLDWPDAGWRLIRQGDKDNPNAVNPDAPRFFTAYGRDVGVPEAGVQYDPTTRRLSLVGGNRAQARAATHEPAVTEYLAGHPGAMTKALDDELVPRIGKDGVRVTIKMMIKAGQLCKHKADRSNAQLHYLTADCPEHGGQPAGPAGTCGTPAGRSSADPSDQHRRTCGTFIESRRSAGGQAPAGTPADSQDRKCVGPACNGTPLVDGEAMCATCARHLDYEDEATQGRLFDDGYRPR